MCRSKYKLYEKIFKSVKNKIDIKQMINALYLERQKDDLIGLDYHKEREKY